jgi:hypothetical protein
VTTADLKTEYFPDYTYGFEQNNYKYRFPVAYCPTVRYQSNSVAGVTRASPSTDDDRLLPVACVGKKINLQALISLLLRISSHFSKF